MFKLISLAVGNSYMSTGNFTFCGKSGYNSDIVRYLPFTQETKVRIQAAASDLNL